MISSCALMSLPSKTAGTYRARTPAHTRTTCNLMRQRVCLVYKHRGKLDLGKLQKEGDKSYGHSPKRNIEKKSATIVLAWPAAAGGCARVGYMHATVFLPRRVSIGLACHEIFTHHQFTSVTLFNKLSIKLLFRVVDFYHYCCSTAGSDEPMRYGLRSHTASAM